MRLALRRRSAALLLATALAALAGCDDLRHFEGQWRGSISPDPAQQHGFAAGDELRLSIMTATRSALALTLVLPGRSDALPFRPMRWAASDALGSLTIEGSPLRTHLGFVEPPGAAPYLVVVSLFPDERVAVRLVRGPEESYGVFALRRVAPIAPGATSSDAAAIDTASP